jgi:hypothetical protein
MQRLLERQRERDERSVNRLERAVVAYEDMDLSSLDVENDNLYESFTSCPELFKAMTGWVKSEFDELFGMFESKLLEKRKGKKRATSRKDCFLIFLWFIAKQPSAIKLSNDIKLSGITISNDMISSIVKYVANSLEGPMIESFVTNLVGKHEYFGDIQPFPEVALITDATVYPVFRPGGDFDMAKKFYCGKHHFYCVKQEVTINRKGLAVLFSPAVQGTDHDFEVFKNRVQIHKDALKKLNPVPHGIQAPVDPLGGQSTWGEMLDKGYEGASRLLRAITPKKGNDLTQAETESNLRIARVRVLVERFLGRLKQRFEVLQEKLHVTVEEEWELRQSIYSICICLTNWEVTKRPLNDNDKTYHENVMKKFLVDENERQLKKRAYNESYARRKKNRTSPSVSPTSSPELGE